MFSNTVGQNESVTLGLHIDALRCWMSQQCYDQVSYLCLAPHYIHLALLGGLDTIIDFSFSIKQCYFPIIQPYSVVNLHVYSLYFSCFSLCLLLLKHPMSFSLSSLSASKCCLLHLLDSQIIVQTSPTNVLSIAVGSLTLENIKIATFQNV